MKSEKLKTTLKSSDNIWSVFVVFISYFKQRTRKLLHQIQFIIYIFVIIIFSLDFFFLFAFIFVCCHENQTKIATKCFMFSASLPIFPFFSFSPCVCVLFLFLAYSSIRATQLQRIYSVCIYISKLSALFTNTNT